MDSYPKIIIIIIYIYSTLPTPISTLPTPNSTLPTPIEEGPLVYIGKPALVYKQFLAIKAYQYV